MGRIQTSVMLTLAIWGMYRAYRILSQSSSSSSSSSSSLKSSMTTTTTTTTTTTNDRDKDISPWEMLPTYDLPPRRHPSPPIHHLTPIDPSALIPTGASNIDVAHRRGELHVGHVLFVMDVGGYVLFLKRSTNVVTCPDTWSVLGEHANIDESPHDAAMRGIAEELGFVVVVDDVDVVGASSASNATMTNIDGGAGGVDAFPPPATGTFVARFRPRIGGGEGRDDAGEDDDDDDDGDIRPPHPPPPPLPLVVTLRNATRYPLYYIRRYGARNDDRVDRQLTYLWYVTFPKRHDEIPLRLDDEVADHVWMRLDDAREWISNDSIEGGDVVNRDDDDDDGPDRGDFCHGTIRSLYEAGLENILRESSVDTE
ncbi:hypothetical protein ACHAXA_001482 [Cyclostephanos tholiformis]|uniref:Nudix hydrolase domain-containing protein n=1 Tax=Cyclostephanos tholiformis TaxID=382380 RepID=A0ABD3RZ25_9STRA